ncbi:hypothetical protein N9D31_00680 [Oligoflexaceae bacterium]|nr:hypothetical protein [Oligoflexaceae bacterium]
MNKIFFYRKKFQNSGMTLASVLVAVSLVGVFAYLLSNIGSGMMVSAKKVGIFAEREDLRNMIRLRTDCDATTASPSNRLIRKAGGGVAFADKYPNQTFGDFEFYISSQGTAGQIYIQAKHKSETSFRNLFQTAPFTCD